MDRVAALTPMTPHVPLEQEVRPVNDLDHSVLLSEKPHVLQGEGEGDGEEQNGTDSASEEDAFEIHRGSFQL